MVGFPPLALFGCPLDHGCSARRRDRGSGYTLLELLVIGAICAWCLTSAVLTTILMLLVVQPLVEPAPPSEMGKPWPKAPLEI